MPKPTTPRINIPVSTGRSPLTGRLLLGSLGFAAIFTMILTLTMLVSDSANSGAVYLALINFNLILIALFMVLMGRRFMMLFLERKKGLVGARLQVRLLAIFGFLAVVPALIVAIFSVVFLNLGIEAWFSGRVTKALDNSLEVAQAYLEEHGNRLLLETRNIAHDPNINSATFFIDPEIMVEILGAERESRGLAELSIYSSRGALLAHVGDLAPAVINREMVEVFNDPSHLTDLKTKGMLVTDDTQGRIAAVVALPFDDTFLVATRWINPAVLDHLDRTRAAFREYYQLRSERNTVRVVFTLFFVLMTVVVLAAAMWAGLNLASRIVKPLGALVQATHRVREGDLTVRVEPMDEDEIGALTMAFNRMTAELSASHDELETKNKELNRRRRGMEAVLTGVTAGVMLVDNRGVVRLANKTARDVLDVKTGQRLGNFNEELHHLVDQFAQQGGDMLQQQVKIDHEGQNRTLLVRLVPSDVTAEGMQSVVVTFDDITTLLSAQRVAAWAEVARRIAHEIKNPLTPIQLSAERLKRRYKEQITHDVDTFTELTDVIVRQVEDMRRMVNEFSDFARMPTPVFAPENIQKLVNEVLLLHRTARADIQFDVVMPKAPISLNCDRGQIRQVLTNLIENAAQAIEEQKRDENTPEGRINVVVKKTQRGKITITVVDNGPGLPSDIETEKLFDPYVTTKKKGTGLGLAIVRKVVDEHGGAIKLVKLEGRGTKAELDLPLSED